MAFEPTLVGRIVLDVARSVPQGDSLPCGRYRLAPFTGNKGGSNGLVVPRVRPTLTRFLTYILYVPVDSIVFHSVALM